MIEDFDIFLRDMKHASELGRYREIGKYDKIVFCGIGGSAYPGEVVKSLDLKIPVFVVKEEMPEFVNEKTPIYRGFRPREVGSNHRFLFQSYTSLVSIASIVSTGCVSVYKNDLLLSIVSIVSIVSIAVAPRLHHFMCF